METAEIKLEIFRYIDNLEQSKLHFIYKQLFSRSADEKNDFWNTLNEQQKEDIEIGLFDLEAGSKKNFDDFMQKFQK